MKLRPVTPDDHLDISILLSTAFSGPLEARIVEELRRGGDMALERLALDENDTPIAYIAFARHVAPENWWSLGPLAVRPSHQNKGIGQDLVTHGIDAARMAGAEAITVYGAPNYYSRVGFSQKAAANLTGPYPKELVLLYTIKPAAAGRSETLVYPPAFNEEQSA